MDTKFIIKIEKFLLKEEKKIIFFQKELEGGKNSKVLKFIGKKKKFVVKVYSDFKRLNREKLFYNFLKKRKISSVLRILYTNYKLKLIIFEYIDGKKIKNISNKDVSQLLIFLNNLNQKIDFRFPHSIDGIKNRKDHVKLCEKKINDLKLINKKLLTSKKLDKFLNEYLIPKFKYLKRDVKGKNFKKYFVRLKKKDLIMSPSDIGFHNILKKKNKLFFFDFEYAGLDDPVKLICDFLCQPDQNITNYQKKIFINNKLFSRGQSVDINFLVKLFLPFHKIKWCCIMLNQIKSLKKNRDISSIIENDNIRKKINKVISYFKKNF